MSEPINEQVLTKIRELLADDGRQWDDYSPTSRLYRVGWSAELLLAEVDRLRAREQALAHENQRLSRRELVKSRDRWLSVAQQRQAQIDAMRPVVALVARGCVDEATIGFPEFIVALDGDDSASEMAYAESLIEQARAFVAAHPRAGESAGGDDELRR